MSVNEDGSDPILNGITDSLVDFLDKEETPMVVSFIAVAEWIDNNGDKHVFADSMEDQRRTTTLGLTRWLDTIERGRLQREDERDDDAS